MSISGIDQSNTAILTAPDLDALSQTEATTATRLPENASLLEKKTALSLEKLESAYTTFAENRNYSNLANVDAALKEFNSNLNELKLEARWSGNPEIQAAYEKLSDANDKALSAFQDKLDEPNRISAAHRAEATKQAESLLPKTQASLEKMESACATYAEDRSVSNYLAKEEAKKELVANFKAFREQAQQCDSLEINQAFTEIAKAYFDFIDKS